MRVPWTARRSNQSILKEISSVYSLEGLMLKLKLQFFGTDEELEAQKGSLTHPRFLSEVGPGFEPWPSRFSLNSQPPLYLLNVNCWHGSGEGRPVQSQMVRSPSPGHLAFIS